MQTSLFFKILKAVKTYSLFWIQREVNYQKSIITDASFFMTYRCTSKCKTCTMWQKGNKTDELNLEGWKKTVDMVYAEGARWIELFGGDVLLRKDILFDLIKYIKSLKDLEVNMITNCNLLDEETAIKLVEAGIDDIWLSIDSINTDHDKVRGETGTFTRVENAIKYLKSARKNGSKPFLRANCTISKYNVHTFDQIFGYCEKLGLDAMHLVYAGEFSPQSIAKTTFEGINPNPYFQPTNESCLLNQEEAKILKNKIKKLKTLSRNSSVEFYPDDIDKCSIKNLTTGQYNVKRCNLLHTRVTVDPAGNILGCPFFDLVSFGNIKDQDLSRIWKNEKHKKMMQAIKDRDFELCKFCIMEMQRTPLFLPRFLRR